MDCSWIKIYDSPRGGNQLDPDDLKPGQTIYIDISEMPEGYEFLGWKDLSGNDLGPEDIELIERNGRYVTTARCSEGFMASIRTGEESVCTLIVSSSDTNQGTVNPNGVVTGCNKTVEISAEPKCCYDFDSWNDTAPDFQDPVRTVTVLNGTASYKAFFVPIEYTIEVYSNNDDYGTVTVDGENLTKVNCGDEFLLEAIPNEGYKFVSWEDGNTDARRAITYECGGLTVYVANFASESDYTVTYNSNYGLEPQTFEQGPFSQGSFITYMNGFSREGYVFEGWCEEPDCSEPSFIAGDTGTYQWEDSVTLYAVWSESVEYKLVYMGKPNDPTIVHTTKPYHSGDTFVLMGDPLNGNGGYNFLGWRLVKSGETYTGSEPIMSGSYTMPSYDVDAHGVWDDKGGKYANLTYVFSPDFENSVITVAEGSTVSAVPPQFFGVDYHTLHKNFNYYLVNNVQTNIGDSILVNGNTDAVAVSTTFPQYTVTFDVNCDDNNETGTPPGSIVCYDGDTVQLPDLSGYVCGENIFRGWSTSNQATAPLYGPGTSIIVENDLDLYGVWEKKSQFRVYYNENNSNASCPGFVPDTTLYTENDTVTVRQCACQQTDGCVCQGWNTQPDGEGTNYEGGDTFTITHNTFLYGMWNECCSVKFTSTLGASIEIDGQQISNNQWVNIEDDTEFTVDPGTGNLWLGWYDMTERAYIEPCDSPDSYEYTLVPNGGEPSNGVTILNDNDFITAINSTVTASSPKFIKNSATGEIRQVVGVCSGSEQYSLVCRHTVLAYVIAIKYTETDGNDGNEYIRYDSNPYNTLYDYMNAHADPSYLTQGNYVEAVIDGISRYYIAETEYAPL